MTASNDVTPGTGPSLTDWANGNVTDIGAPLVVPYDVIDQRSPDHHGDYWKLCRALAAGGRQLLGDTDLMRRIMPPTNGEDPGMYYSRLTSAHYVNHAGAIQESILATAFSDPLSYELDADPGPVVAGYWAALQRDCSPPGGVRTTLNDVLHDSVESAFSCEGLGWVLADFPRVPDGVDPERMSAGDQDRMGTNAGYLCAVSPESVIAWADGADGDLEWAVMKDTGQVRPNPFTKEPITLERWWYYTATHWWRYEYRRRPDERVVDAGAQARLADYGTHSLGRVPLRPLRLGKHLRVMDKIESLARAHLNATNGLHRSMLRSLFPVLMEFLSDERSPGETRPHRPAEDADDPNRVFRTPRGPGFVQVRQEGDRAEWLAPSSDPFAVALQIAESIEKAMYAVVHQAALNSDPKSASAIGRSGESKKADRMSATIVAKALGQAVRAFALDLIETIAIGRGEAALVPSFKLHGLENFATMTAADALEQATMLDLLKIPSSTFASTYQVHTAELVMGESATPEVMEKVRAEIESANAHEFGGPKSDAVRQAVMDAAEESRPDVMRERLAGNGG